MPHKTNLEKCTAKVIFTWTVEIEVDELTVKRGFALTDEFVKGLMHNYELAGSRIRIIKAPSEILLARAQGYRDADHRRDMLSKAQCSLCKWTGVKEDFQENCPGCSTKDSHL